MICILEKFLSLLLAFPSRYKVIFHLMKNVRGSFANLDLIIFFRAFGCNGIKCEKTTKESWWRWRVLPAFVGFSFTYAYLLAASLPDVSHICNSITSLHSRFPQIVAGEKECDKCSDTDIRKIYSRFSNSLATSYLSDSSQTLLLRNGSFKKSGQSDFTLAIYVYFVLTILRLTAPAT